MDSRTAIIADVHLGYSWAQRRRGELGPLVDAGTREKLLRVTDELQPARIVFLGDLVHAPRPCEPERAYIESILNELASRAELVAVRGNHDRAFAREFGNLAVRTVECWKEHNVCCIHGDKLPEQSAADLKLVIGHLHPALPVVDSAGAGRKIPVFLASSCCIVLPAFSPFAGENAGRTIQQLLARNTGILRPAPAESTTGNAGCKWPITSLRSAALCSGSLSPWMQQTLCSFQHSTVRTARFPNSRAKARSWLPRTATNSARDANSFRIDSM